MRKTFKFILIVIFMSRVPRSWRFSDPTKWEKLEYVRPCAKYPKKQIKEYVDENNKHSGRRVPLYKEYEELFLENLENVVVDRDKFIFITGLSPDLTMKNPFGFRPKMRGVDFFQDQNRLSNELLRLHAEVGASSLEDVIYFPIAPLSLPVKIKKKVNVLQMIPAFPEPIKNMKNNGRGFGTTIKTYDLSLKDISFTPQRGTYEFSMFYYKKPQGRDFYEENYEQMADMALRYGKNIDDIPGLVGLARYIHKKILSKKIENYIQKLGIEKPVLYCLKTSYCHDVFSGLNPKELDIGRNLEYPLLAEAEPSCLNILKGYLEELV